PRGSPRRTPSSCSRRCGGGLCRASAARPSPPPPRPASRRTAAAWRHHSFMYEILQHTADVRLRVTASSLEELFADALQGLMAVMGTPVGAHSVRPETEEIELDSVDLTAVLVDFLNEALVRALVGRRRFTGASFAS